MDYENIPDTLDQMEDSSGFILDSQKIERRTVALWMQEANRSKATSPHDLTRCEQVNKIVESAEKAEILAGFTVLEAFKLICFYVGYGTGFMHCMDMNGIERGDVF